MLHAGCWPWKHNDRGRASGRVRRLRSAIRRTGTAGCARRFAEVLVPSWSFHPNWHAWVRCNNVMLIRQRAKIKLRLRIPRIGIRDRPRRGSGQPLLFSPTVSDYSDFGSSGSISAGSPSRRCAPRRSHSDQWNCRRRSTSRIRRSRSATSVACDKKRSMAIACQRSERRAYRLKSIGNNLRRAADRRSPRDSCGNSGGSPALPRSAGGVTTDAGDGSWTDIGPGGTGTTAAGRRGRNPGGQSKRRVKMGMGSSIDRRNCCFAQSIFGSSVEKIQS